MEDTSATDGPSKPRARIENACLPCQGRKIKCDGNGSTCSQCSKRGAHCVYKQRRTRGLGKSKEHVRELEERLEKLEQLLRNQGTAPSEETESGDGSDARGKSPQVTNINTSPLPIGMPPPQAQSTGVIPPGLIPELSQTPDRPGAMRLPELVRLPRHAYMKMITRTGKTGPLPMKVFIPLHPQADLTGLVASTAENVGHTYPLFTSAYIKALTDQVVNSSPANPAYDPTLVAISSTLVAIAMQWKVENSSVAQLSSMMWSHFKNAFSMLSYLLMKGSSVLAFHALVLMTVFLQGCAEMRLATHLITSAVRVAQMAGIPLRTQGHDIATELNLRAFWTMCALDVEMSIKLMIFPVIDNHHLCLRLPSQEPPEPMAGTTEDQIRILGFQASLATTRSKIHKQYLLYTNQPRTLMPELEPVERFEEQLGLWRRSLPVEIRPLGPDQSTSRQLPLSIILLHFQYYHSKSIVLTLRTTLQDGDPENMTALPGDVSSARATIRLLSAISAYEDQFSCIWRMLLYPLSMTLLLLYDVLRDPQAPSAETSVLAIKEFVNYLRRIKQDLDCDVNKLLEGCTRMHCVAQSAILPEYPLPVARTNNSLDYSLDRLRQILSSRTDYLPLAQRLLSDMPDSENEMLASLTNILRVDWDPSDSYGPFVSDVLKADTYNFGFEFTS
ncbi:hypothetical protein QQX98_008201 [Neonectria punicea]|uniref:Zn(2)-C6 fungal-type domain-containing protein n=1 Tax=Neonectria punicea TaxID=979145 RepID=A0ABR1GVR0_9HYPO